LVNLEQFRRNTPVTADSSESSSEKNLLRPDNFSLSLSVTGQPQIEIMTEEFEENIIYRGKKAIK
jgi:hypothetical protein